MSTSKKNQQQHLATEKVARHLLKTGLSQTSLRQLANAAGISDRMLLYYFDNKDDVLQAAIFRVAEKMTDDLQTAIPPNTKLSPASLFALAATQMRGAEFAPYMRLWMESIGQASQGVEPFATISGPIMGRFADWIAATLDVVDAVEREKTAAMMLVMIDGLTLMDIGNVPEISDLAIERLCVLFNN